MSNLKTRLSEAAKLVDHEVLKSLVLLAESASIENKPSTITPVENIDRLLSVFTPEPSTFIERLDEVEPGLIVDMIDKCHDMRDSGELVLKSLCPCGNREVNVLELKKLSISFGLTTKELIALVNTEQNEERAEKIGAVLDGVILEECDNTWYEADNDEDTCKWVCNIDDYTIELIGSIQRFSPALINYLLNKTKGNDVNFDENALQNDANNWISDRYELTALCLRKKLNANSLKKIASNEYASKIIDRAVEHVANEDK